MIDLVNSLIIFLSQRTLFRWLTFLLGSLTVTLKVLLFWIFLSFDASICSTMVFLPLGNSDHVIVSVSVEFLSNSQQDAPFNLIAYDYSCTDWDSLHDHLKGVPWEDIFKLSASAAASEICELFQVGIGVYIPHQKYQVKLHSWFSAACAAAIVHRNHIFHLYLQNKSSDSKVKFRKASNRWKKILEASKPAKQKSASLPRNLALGLFDELLIVFSTKVNLLYLLYSLVQRCCLLHLIKQNCISGISLPIFP